MYITSLASHSLNIYTVHGILHTPLIYTLSAKWPYTVFCNGRIFVPSISSEIRKSVCCIDSQLSRAFQCYEITSATWSRCLRVQRNYHLYGNEKYFVYICVCVCVCVYIYIYIYLFIYLFIYYIHGFVHRNSILIRYNKMQQYAGIYLLQDYSTCFGCL